MKLTLAIDAMGGDKAPEMVIRGANIARERFPHIHFLFFGDENRLKPLLDRHKKLHGRYEIVDTGDQVIRNDQSVSVALRTGKKSSMWQAVAAVKEGRAHCVVSAGNTGALMAISKLVLRSIEGIHRPAIASFFPTKVGESVMLDLGANIDCDADNIVQFALMGETFAQTVLGLPAPTVGILNVGSEEHKGNEYLRDAANILKSIEGMKFSGFIEGDDIARGKTDVVVTDGFTGNIALKTAEGVGELYGRFLAEAIRNSVFAKIGYLFAKSAFRKLKLRLDPRRYNGAVFLGLNGISVKSHGGTDAVGFATALGVAVNLAEHHFIDHLRKRLHALDNSPSPRQAAVL